MVLAPTGATNCATFERDWTNKVNGETSYTVAVAENVPCIVGIAQDGLAVQHGIACNFPCFLKSDGIRGPIRVWLHHVKTDFATCELPPPVDARWHK